jgi:predicted permease
MNWITQLLLRRRLYGDFSQEIREHLEEKIDELVASGMSREEATYAARREFGNATLIEERGREVWQWPSVESFIADVRYALRMLSKNPGFTVVAVLTLALGIGANTGIFTILNGAALRPLPLPDSDRLASIYQSFRGRVRRNVYGEPNLFSYSEYQDYRDHNHVFSGLVAYQPSVEATLGSDRPQQVDGTLVSCNYFPVFGVQPTLGRGFLDSECAKPGANPVVVLSDALWRSTFAASPSILGTTITLNRSPFTVIGIAPPGFGGSEIEPSAFWAPVTMQRAVERGSKLLDDDNLSWLVLIGRMRAGVSLGQVRAELDVIAGRLDQDHPGRKTTLAIQTATFFSGPEEHAVALGVGAAILGAVGLVLLIACANVASLLLARAAGRRHEIAVRLALGATRRRLVRQLLTESFLIAALGGVLGSLLAFWSAEAGVHLLLTHLPRGAPSLVFSVSPDARVLIFALLLTLITGAAFGLMPALEASRPDVNTTLKQGDARYHGGPVAGGRLRRVLVGVQVAVCMVLLISAGLLMRGLYRAQTIDPGFDTKDVAVASFDLTAQGYSQPRAATFQQQLMERLTALPGVDGVAETGTTPLSDSHFGTGVSIAGREGWQQVEYNIVSPNYFSLLGIPVTRGRGFAKSDSLMVNDGQLGTASVVVVTESTARRFWPGQDPIGKTLKLQSEGHHTVTVVGVARDAQVSRPGESDTLYLYFPAGPKDQPGLQFLVHSAIGFAGAAQGIKAAAHALDPELPVSVVRLEDNLEIWRAPSRIVSVVSGVLGALALLLASLGVYGMVSYAVSGRVREIGIRMTLGADGRDVLNLVLRQALRPVAVGTIIGLACSAAVSNALSSLLYGVSPHDLVSFLFIPFFLLSVTILASYVPARRATKVDPMVALRNE